MMTPKPSAAAFFASCSATAGGAVCRADADLDGNVEGLQAIDAFFHHLEIAVRAHDDQNLFHVILLLKNKLGHGDIPVS